MGLPDDWLDVPEFHRRLIAEAGRVRRHGGFATLALLAYRLPPTASAPAIETVAAQLVGRVRVQDVVGKRSSSQVGWLMPDTDMPHGCLALQRLLGLAPSSVEAHDGSTLGAGIATTYGELRSGADALVEAAREALAMAAPGCYERSPTLDGRPRLLIVDDDRVFAEALADTVSDHGWKGRACSAPDRATHLIRDHAYSAVFLDLVMPGASGAQLLRESLLHCPGRPVILMTGYDTVAEAVIDALAVGGPVTLVKKPMTSADVAGALEMFRHLLPGIAFARQP
jgi:CheY-like chemotaxis protein